MLETHNVFHLLAAVLQVFTGLLANGLILVVNGIDFIRQRKIAPFDLLLSCLVTSRIILQLCVFSGLLVALFLVNSSVFTDNAIFIMFINELNLWFATWLGVFYCTKIATIPHPLFLWLKMKIFRLVPWLILGSVLYATVTASIYSKNVSSAYIQPFINIFSQNVTHLKEMYALPSSFSAFGLMLPFLIFLVAVLLLIFSLWKHSRKMRTISTGSRKPGRHAHISAMLSILSFLTLYFSHCMVGILLSTQVIQFGSTNFLLCILMMGVYPSIHSIILILGNPKLRQSAWIFLQCKCCQLVRVCINTRNP
ncbi:taste receptor type 2 member 1 [Nannospalax galili]|uniref:Taste receptor type 2 n=1 Tax=Nannospalax galili TaxID=1026970 RepID=A0A0N9P284_NANGA|nr:taste receptor type 2 member 1 [Nannospalax galili]ALG92863.1 taste receptor type 2 member 17 [Nannospalax galili]ALG92864.1 taste receptor type 2 member 17 [Nannospalax galili]ALG92865.1 taste receptor type 2 member 17 [Nannospalax galili]ALG92866.1 taste receptor type 2 member 17 [Nannospalax galili]ALG92867.1 taste receptor type 2 member 17 [Nannospalax galili]